MKRVIKYLLIFSILISLPFLIFIIVGESVPNRYKNAFTSSLVDKYERLNSINEKKIVFVGGSSVPFSLRSDLIEEELGYKVVDLGVYATLGTKVMMELSLSNLNEGDIVILAPEVNEQTYSLYFNSNVFLKASSEKSGMIKYLSYDEKEKCVTSYLRFLYDKISISSSEDVSDDELYSRTSFNEYGDIKYERSKNIMPGYYDKSQLISLDFEMDEFLSYVNAYYKKLEKKGVTLYYLFSPINKDAIIFNAEEKTGFMQKIESKLNCSLLGDLSDYSYESKYFYNTNYHLNDIGAIMHTINIIDKLKNKLNINTPTNIIIPDIEEESGGTDILDNDKYVLSKVGGTYYITGIKDEYKNNKTLVLDSEINGIKISGLSSGCFNGCTALEELTIPDGYSIFDIGVFNGCSNLKIIHIEILNPGATSIPDEGLFDGTSADLKVYVKKERYSAYASNYTWARYKDYLYKE